MARPAWKEETRTHVFFPEYRGGAQSGTCRGFPKVYRSTLFLPRFFGPVRNRQRILTRLRYPCARNKDSLYGKVQDNATALRGAKSPYENRQAGPWRGLLIRKGRPRRGSLYPENAGNPAIVLWSFSVRDR